MNRYLFCLCVVTFAGGCPAGNDSPDAMTSGNCLLDSDCSEGRKCNTNVCRAPGTALAGARCTATRDCQSGLYCDELSGRCAQPTGSGVVGSSCLEVEECTAGLRCNYIGFSGVCVEPGTATVGDNCTAQTDCLAGLYCGRTNTCDLAVKAFPPFAGVMCPADTAPFHSYFQVPRPGAPLQDFYRLPYPNDIRVTTTGDLDLSDFPRPGPTMLGLDIVDAYLDALSEDFDGFSGMAPVAFRFSKPIDDTFYANNAQGNVFLVDLDAKQGLGAGLTYTQSKSDFSCENYLTVYPTLTEAPLRAGHTYMVLLLSGNLRSSGGDAPNQDPDLAAVLGNQRPTDAALARAWDQYAKMRSYLISDMPQLPLASIMNAAVFTVGDPTVHMQRLATAAAAQPAPVLSSLFQCGVTSGTDACSDGTPARACGSEAGFVEIHGKVKLPIFQTGTAPYLREGGALNEIGNAVTKVRDEEVCFAMTLPTGTPPAAGWPLVIYGHGTGGSFRSFITDGVAAQLTGANPKVAVLSIDQVGHGARRNGSTRSPEELVFNVANPRAARDNFAQGAADLLALFRVPSSPAPVGWTGPQIKFAPKVVLFGHSQGSTHGELALPFTTDAPAAVLSGAGANLSVSLLTKTSPSDIKEGLRILLSDAIDYNHPMIAIWQQFFDRVDPANFNRHIIQSPLGSRPAKNVLMTWGRQDTFSTDDTMLYNATYLGVTPVGAIVDDAGGALTDVSGTVLLPSITRPVTLSTLKGVVIQYNPASGEDGHFVAFDVATAIADWKAFITSYFATGTPVIP